MAQQGRINKQLRRLGYQIITFGSKKNMKAFIKGHHSWAKYDKETKYDQARNN